MKSLKYYVNIVDKHWAIRGLTLLVLIIGSTYGLINFYVIQPKNDEIEKLRGQKSEKIINVFNYNNNIIRIPELRVQMTGQLDKEQIISSLIKATSESAPVEINNTPVKLVEESVNVKNNEKGQIITSATSTNYNTKMVVDYLTTPKGNSLEFKPVQIRNSP